jgi:4-amino-4-deoxy-L-arabinose transferase-like glycosyltransferase
VTSVAPLAPLATPPSRPRAAELCLLFLILAASLVPRLPVLYNSGPAFNSDEAVNALVLEHLLEKGEFTLHNWDAHYYGIVEGLLCIPFVLALGYVPLAFKLGSMVGFFALVVAVWALGRRLYGTAAGLAAAAVLVGFSQAIVLWSTMASGGYALVAAWGTFSLLFFDYVRRRPSAWRFLALGVVIGFGLYIYELFLVWLAVLGLALLTSSFVWKALLSRTREDRREALAAAPRQLRDYVLMAAGALLGWAPKLAVVLLSELGTKKPSYLAAGLEVIRRNVRLLLLECIPSMLGAVTAPAKPPKNLLIEGLGVLLVAVWGWIWLRAAWRIRQRVLGVLARPPQGELDTESLLVLLVPVTALLFVISPNPQDVLSNRYLLPWLSALPVLGGAFLVELARGDRRSRLAAALLVLFLAGLPLVQIARWERVEGYLGPGWRLVRADDPLERLLEQLRRRGTRGAYGRYWTKYKATFLSGEQIVFGSFGDWDRYPAYTEQVDRLASPVYVFQNHFDDRARETFLTMLRTAGSRAITWDVGPYHVYASPSGRRLLPPVGPPAKPLKELRSAVAARVPPAAWTCQRLRIPVTVTNLGSSPWSALGFEIGVYRVNLSYRWLDEAGQPVVAEGDRTLLPGAVRPGESVRVTAEVRTPSDPGRYQLVLTLVQEGVTWFDAAGGGAAVVPVTVVQATGVPQVPAVAAVR